MPWLIMRDSQILYKQFYSSCKYFFLAFPEKLSVNRNYIKLLAIDDWNNMLSMAWLVEIKRTQ